VEVERVVLNALPKRVYRLVIAAYDAAGMEGLGPLAIIIALRTRRSTLERGLLRLGELFWVVFREGWSGARFLVEACKRVDIDFRKIL